MYKIVHLLKKRDPCKVVDFQSSIKKCFIEAGDIDNYAKCTLSLTIIGGYRKGTPKYDAMIELWFSNEKELKMASGKNVDELWPANLKNYLDIKSTLQLSTVEHVIKDCERPRNGVKNVELVTKKKNMGVTEFQDYWRKIHGPMGASIKQVLRYEQNHVIPYCYETSDPQLDGLALTWFFTTNDMRASALSSEYKATREDEENFLEIPLDFLIMRELVLP